MRRGLIPFGMINSLATKIRDPTGRPIKPVFTALSGAKTDSRTVV